MAGFSGFTDEEIFRLKMQGQGLNQGEKERREPVKKALINSSGKRGKSREKIRTRQTDSRCNSTHAEEEPSTSPTKCRRNEAVKKPDENLMNDKVLDEKKSVEKAREVEVIMEPEK